MAKRNLTIWDKIAPDYAAELITSASEVHFGVGIPGNDTLHLIPGHDGGAALDLGCGAGENLVALSKLGYEVTGIDGSTSQLELAEELLATNGVRGNLVRDDICHLSWQNDGLFDAIISVGVLHFCHSLDQFLGGCSRLAKPGAVLVLSMPHPLDMIVETREVENERLITVRNYFPEDNMISNAHYWQKFAGKLELAVGLTEYICRPSDVINALIGHGFQIDGVWEPRADDREDVPCRYRDPEPWFVHVLCPRIPQYLIIKSTFRGLSHVV